MYYCTIVSGGACGVLSTYVYEDACIGAIVDAVARIDNSFQDKGYRTVLTQTAGRRIRTLGDLVLGLRGSAAILVEFKAPILEDGQWCYRLRPLNRYPQGLRGVVEAFTNENAFLVGLVHAYADTVSAEKLQQQGLNHATYIHAPYTTVFMPFKTLTRVLEASGAHDTVRLCLRPESGGKIRPWDLERLPRTSLLLEGYDYTVPYNCTSGDIRLTLTRPHSAVLDGYTLYQLLKCLEQATRKKQKTIGTTLASSRVAKALAAYAEKRESRETRNMLVLVASTIHLELETLAQIVKALMEGKG